mgnify:CR=1 FL=1
MNKNIETEDLISFRDIYFFFASQWKSILLVFLTVAILGTIYIVLQPVTYSSAASVEIGEITSLYQGTAPLETQDEVAYKYSDFAQVSPVKGTRIVQISAVSLSPEKSEESIINTINLITSSHGKILLDKENNLIRFLEKVKVTDTTKSEYLRLLEGASRVHITRQISSIKTIEVPYGGKSKKAFIALFVISLIAAIFFALMKTLIETERKRSRSI